MCSWALSLTHAGTDAASPCLWYRAVQTASCRNTPRIPSLEGCAGEQTARKGHIPNYLMFGTSLRSQTVHLWSPSISHQRPTSGQCTFCFPHFIVTHISELCGAGGDPANYTNLCSAPREAGREREEKGETSLMGFANVKKYL